MRTGDDTGMNYKPKVSICIPTFNGEAYLGAALQSVADQTLNDLEVIIADDGSDDATLEIANSWAKDLPLRILPPRERSTLAANWNRTIAASNGEWTKLLFQDDLLRPECLRLMVQAGEEHGSFVVCERGAIYATGSEHRNEEYERHLRIATPGAAFRGRHVASPAEFAHAVLLYRDVNFIGEPVATLFRRELFDRLGGFDHGLIQLLDLEYWTRLGTNAGLVVVHDQLALFRVHNRAATVRNLHERRFRTLYLDPLLLYLAWMHAPAYASLRGVSEGAAGTIQRLTALQAATAHEAAEKEQAAGNTEPLEEWTATADLHPELYDLTQLGDELRRGRRVERVYEAISEWLRKETPALHRAISHVKLRRRRRTSRKQ